MAQGGGVAASAVPQNFQNFSELSEFSEFLEFSEFFRIFAKSLKFQNFRKIQNFRSLYGIFFRIVKGGDPHIALYFPKVIYYLLSVLLPLNNILLSFFPQMIYYLAFYFPQTIYHLLSALLPLNNILPIPSPSPGIHTYLECTSVHFNPHICEISAKKPSKMHQSISSALTHSHLSHLMTCPSLRVDDPLLGGRPSSLVVMHT